MSGGHQMGRVDNSSRMLTKLQHSIFASHHDVLYGRARDVDPELVKFGKRKNEM